MCNNRATPDPSSVSNTPPPKHVSPGLSIEPPLIYSLGLWTIHHHYVSRLRPRDQSHRKPPDNIDEKDVPRLPHMTKNQWQQTQGKIISLNERKAQILEKQDPLPVRMERRNVAEVYKWNMKFGRKIEALNQSREREEAKAKKAKDKETARKVQEQGKGAQKKTKEEQKEQRKTKKENRRQKKQNQMETEKMERNQAEPTNDPPSTQVECCQTAAECLLKDHIECLFRLTININ